MLPSLGDFQMPLRAAEEVLHPAVPARVAVDGRSVSEYLRYSEALTKLCLSLALRCLSFRSKQAATLAKLDLLSSWSGRGKEESVLQWARQKDLFWVPWTDPEIGTWKIFKISVTWSCNVESFNVGHPQLLFHSGDRTLVSYTVQDCNNNNSNNKLHPPLTTPLNTISPLLPDSFSSGYWPPSLSPLPLTATMEKEDMETLVSEDNSDDGCSSRKRAELL